MGQYIDILDFSPQTKMSKQNLVKLSDSIIIVWQLIITDIDCSTLFCKTANTLHILSVGTKSRSTKYIFMLINQFTILQGGNSMVISTIDPISAASSRKKQTKKRSIFLIEQISGRIANIQFWITSSQSSLLLLIIFRTDILTIPKIILLIALFICIIVSKRGLNLFSSSLLLRNFRELQIFLKLFLGELFWQKFMDIEFWGGWSCEGRQIILEMSVLLLGQLPN